MMKKWITNLSPVFLMIFALIVNGCSAGSKDSPTASNASKSSVFGVASLDTAGTSTISVRDFRCRFRKKRQTATATEFTLLT